MKRLTERDAQGNWTLKGVNWQQLYVGQVITKEVQEKLYGALCKLLDYEKTGLEPYEVESLKEENEWIPIKYREITDKERAEEHIPDNCKYRHICDMPEDEERILVTNGNTVWSDMCCIDPDGYYLDSDYDWLDVTAWKPLPKPYEEREK